MNYHTPVLLRESIDFFQPLEGKTIVDATLGNGGHTLEFLRSGAKVVAFDADVDNLLIAQKRIETEGLSKNFTAINDNFINIQKYLDNPVDGLMADLGLSTNQIKEFGKGFSFNDDQSIDMRIDSKIGVSAEEIINTADYEELVLIFSKYGQEPFAKPLSMRIISERQKSPIKTGKRLAEIVRKYYLDKKNKTKIDPSTKIFMALRIVVNSEYSNLKKLLEMTFTLIKKEGRAGIITFHSGEDRIVKQFIRNNNLLEIANIVPSIQEIKDNPLSRSSRLRGFKIS